jgi:hypothetical protein
LVTDEVQGDASEVEEQKPALDQEDGLGFTAI